MCTAAKTHLRDGYLILIIVLFARLKTNETLLSLHLMGCLAVAKLKLLSVFISLLYHCQMLSLSTNNRKVKVVLA